MGESIIEQRTVPLKDIHFDSQTYRTISMRANSENSSIESVVNKMLKKQLAMEGFANNGLQLFHKEIVRILADAIPDDQLAQLARRFPALPREMVILNVDGMRPNLTNYIKSFASFMDVNGYAFRIEKNEKEGTITFFTKHGLGHNYSIFWGEIIKMTLANLAEIAHEELTDTSIFLECKVLDPSKHSV